MVLTLLLLLRCAGQRVLDKNEQERMRHAAVLPVGVWHLLPLSPPASRSGYRVRLEGHQPPREYQRVEHCPALEPTTYVVILVMSYYVTQLCSAVAAFGGARHAPCNTPAQCARQPAAALPVSARSLAD